MGTTATIGGIPSDWVAEVLQMNAYLVGPAGEGVALDEGFPLLRSAQAVSGECRPTTFNNSHFLPVDRMTTNGSIDFSVWHTEDSIDKRKIGFFDFTGGELC